MQQTDRRPGRGDRVLHCEILGQPADAGRPGVGQNREGLAARALDLPPTWPDTMVSMCCTLLSTVAEVCNRVEERVSAELTKCRVISGTVSHPAEARLAERV